MALSRRRHISMCSFYFIFLLTLPIYNHRVAYVLTVILTIGSPCSPHRLRLLPLRPLATFPPSRPQTDVPHPRHPPLSPRLPTPSVRLLRSSLTLFSLTASTISSISRPTPPPQQVLKHPNPTRHLFSLPLRTPSPRPPSMASRSHPPQCRPRPHTHRRPSLPLLFFRPFLRRIHVPTLPLPSLSPLALLRCRRRPPRRTGSRSGEGEEGGAGVYDQLERGETGDGEEDGGMGPAFG